MRVLWITNTLFPDVCTKLGIEPPVIGGWMYAGAKALLTSFDEIRLGVASLYAGNELKILNIGGITYYLVPNRGKGFQYAKSLEQCWVQVAAQFQPDVVHIHGTEYPHGLAYVKACGNINLVVSIQGLVSVYERYYFGGIPEKDLNNSITPRDIIRNDTLFIQRKKMRLRGYLETELIQSIKYIIGRTSWDKAHAWAINPSLRYFFSNETLRGEFYKYKWKLDTCEKYTIFLSQAHYPIKGLQQVIAALPLIIKHYPQTRVYVAGSNFTNKSYLKQNGFGKYVSSRMKALGLLNTITFLGLLSEEAMCQRYLKSHVFICPSSIENSPNSIGEAQLLGVPCVGAFVGGMDNMIEHGESGLLYRFEETEMLAENICHIFSDPALALKLSENSAAIARVRHNQEINSQSIRDVYASIMDSKVEG
jgi:glycosyltransferase involved in cell wall biosynthesis